MEKNNGKNEAKEPRRKCKSPIRQRYMYLEHSLLEWMFISLKNDTFILKTVMF